MKAQGLKQLTLITAGLALTACGNASFDPYVGGIEVASSAMSSIAVSQNNIADGITPANVTVQLKTASGSAVANANLNLWVSGSNNVIVPCGKTDEKGMARCRFYTTTAESKTVRASGDVTLWADTNFMAPKPSRSAVAIVSSGAVITLPSGHKIISTTGISETPARQRDSYQVVRLHSSIHGSIISD